MRRDTLFERDLRGWKRNPRFLIPYLWARLRHRLGL